MYDLTDLIFEKYSEGKLTEEKMMMLLEASNYITLPLAYNKNKLQCTEQQKQNVYDNLRKIKYSLKILESTKVKKDIKRAFDLYLKPLIKQFNFPEYYDYMILSSVFVSSNEDGSIINFSLRFDYRSTDESEEFFKGHFPMADVSIDNSGRIYIEVIMDG